MLVMGICDGHDSGACLTENGSLLCAVSEERLTRIKRQAGFPYNAVSWCLGAAGKTPDAVDRVAVAERTGRSLHRALNRVYSATNPSLPMHRLPNRLSSTIQNLLAQNTIAAAVDRRLSRQILKRRIARLGFTAQLSMMDHHLAHAACAAAWSGFEEALVLIQDAYGDGCSGTVWRWRQGRLEPLHKIPYPNSPSLLYGLVASYLGFAEGEEGKVSGMAAAGDPAAVKPLFDRLLKNDRETIRLVRFPGRRRLAAALSGFSPKDIAAGVQTCVQQVLAEFTRYWAQKTGVKNLCLAGGLFANVRINQTITEAGDFADLFVFPHMGDGGLCAGAAWVAAGDEQQPAPKLKNIFLGPEITNDSSNSTLAPDAISHPLDEAAIEKISKLLADGQAIAVAAGRLEFGPRALGNRSILFAATDKKLADRIGAALGRPSMMPFAPAIRTEDLELVTEASSLSALTLMTTTVNARPGLTERYPVAVHLDGTMRLQTVNREQSPLLWRILTAYRKYEDPALLINTSFNLHTEPIVDSSQRALELFARIGLDGLVLGNTFLERRS